MFRKNDPYTYRQFSELTKKLKSGQKETVGSAETEYQVTLYEDLLVRNAASVARPRNRRYLVNCTMRMNVFNRHGLDINPVVATAYEDYPALISAYLRIADQTGATVDLIDYSPQTVNTVVQASGSTGIQSGVQQSSTVSNTVGSMTSQTNSYGTSVSLSETPSVSANYEHSTTQTDEQSRTKSREASASSSAEASSSGSMSIKDWGSYALVNPLRRAPTWLFGQEYPWDVIQCRLMTGSVRPGSDQVEIIIPQTMAARLCDGKSLYPPSQLSLFGINFVIKAQWLLTIDNGASEEISVEGNIDYFAATHERVAASPPQTNAPYTAVVYMDPLATTLHASDNLSATIDVALMALHPLGFEGQTAIIGFIPEKFTVSPNSNIPLAPPVPFKIFSTTNTMLINDTTKYPSNAGLARFSASETSLLTTFSPECPALQMTAYFKIADVASDYVLYLKHWKTGSVGVQLTFVINDDLRTRFTKHVDALEAEGGDNNLLAIALRNQDYASIDYHDYLQLGLNSIQITIEPDGAKYVADCGYQLRAISIEKA